MGPPSSRSSIVGPGRALAACALLCVLAACAARDPQAAGAGGPAPGGPPPRLVALPSVVTVGGKGSETVGIQASTGRLAVSNSNEGSVEVYDLSRPERPALLAVHPLGLARGEEVTCVALHPRLDLFVTAIRAADPLRPGRLQAHSLSGGKLIGSAPVGIEPDSVYIDPTGRFALVANEAEAFEARAGGPRSAPGSLTWIRLAADGGFARVEELALPDASGIEGFTRPEDGRTIERTVGSERLQIPLADASPALLEPEVVAFAPDGTRAVVTLQENNGVVLVDTTAPAVLGLWGLGKTRHLADLADDGQVRIDRLFEALREPDGVAFTPDGRYFVTADEGDTDPKASDLAPGLPGGGGRTLSVFDAHSGAFVGDTGAALDLGSAAIGAYPDDRSDNRGSEPEMVVCFFEAGRSFALVTLERADALALVDLADPARPLVCGVARTEGEGPHAPEGLAHYRDPSGRHFAYTANEESGRLGVFEVSF